MVHAECGLKQKATKNGGHMKGITIVITAMLLAVPAAFSAEEPAEISDLVVQGKIEGENIAFDLSFKVDVGRRNTTIPLVAGDVAHLSSDLPSRAELSRQESTFFLTLPSRGKQSVKFQFASGAVKDGEWRQTSFTIPASSIRKLSVICDRDDLEVVFPGALNVQKGKTKDGLTEVTAFLGLSNSFSVRWKPTVKKLSAELVVACDANTIASASIGAMKIDNIFTYRVVQGMLKKLSLELPKNLNVTQVRGEDIQDWLIEDAGKGARRLNVTLSRHKDTLYKLQVESETVLPKFPCELDLPVITPQDVIRSSGFLLIGTDSAIKLLVKKALGLTQVDQTSFPAVVLSADKKMERPIPSRSKFAYQYANLPYTLALSADDIISEYSSYEQIVLSLEDNDLVFSGSAELDIRDAPTREIVIETDPKWIAANVEGSGISDYDVRDEGGKRLIYVYFRDAVLGTALIKVRLEQALGEDSVLFSAPAFQIRGAKTERGFIVLSAEKGLRLKQDKAEGLREVHTGSVETRVPGAQLAYRFKKGEWKLSVNVDRTKPTINSEIFHLVSIGEGVLYCSAAVTYHIEGAPVRSFKIIIPKEFQNVEFTGRDVRGWQNEGELWTVSLQEKVIGDYTLGVSYNKHFAYKGDEISAGGVRTEGTTSEAGCIVLASSASLNLTLKNKDESIIEIDRNEVPDAYILLVNDPILKSYKYVSAPHVAKIRVEHFATEQLLDQVADHTEISTEISKDGEAVTRAVYSIKNLSKQFLAVTLPAGAKLWSTRLINEQDVKQDVPAMLEGDKTLIPIHRLSNPNMPVRVELVYAQNGKKLGILGRTLKFEAPVAPDTHSTFANWNFKTPEKYSVADASGNMTPAAVPWVHGIAKVFADALRLCGLALTSFIGWFLLAAALLICACVLVYNRGRGRSLVWRAIVSVIVITALFVPAVAVQSGRTFDGLNQLANIFRFGGGQPVGISVTKTVSLAATEPLTVKLAIAPVWIGQGGSFGMAIFGVAFGIWLYLRSISGDRKGASLSAFGLTVMTLGVAELAIGRTILLLLLVLGAPLAAAKGAIRRSYNRGRRKMIEKEKGTEPPLPFEKESMGVEDDEKSHEKGNARIWFLGLIAFLGLCLVVAAKAVTSSVPALPVVKSVEITVNAPAMNEEAEKSAAVAAVIEFKLESPGQYRLLSPPAVLTSYKLNSRHLSIQTSPAGYLLSADDDGKYQISLNYSVPVVEREGIWSTALEIPGNLGNKVTLRIPEKELDVESPDAALLKTSEKKNMTEAFAVYGSAAEARLSWKARVRKTKLEKVVFFSEVNSIAVFGPGMVELMSLIRCQIAQGEMKSMTYIVPAGMNVTAVQAPGLSTWRFDPATRVLEAVLEKPVSGDFTFKLVSQTGCEGLPYGTVIGALEVKDTVRQRGSIALAVPDDVQIQVDKTKGLNPMNIEDVPAEVISLAGRGIQTGQAKAIKRAFRYQSLPVSASVRAERVLPEIRLTENASLSVADERIVLSSQLGVTVSKAGIFSLTLCVPKGYDVETLTGQDISHWDEVDQMAAASDKATVRQGGKTVVVHFRKQVLGTRTINIAISRTEKGIEETIDVPRISAIDAFKHTGSLVVSGERGVRMTTVEREGVSEVNPRDLGISEAGVLAFRLLRPEWIIRLKTEVVFPTIRAEMLQCVDISEGMLKGTVYVRYKIDNAGCKKFLIQAPSPSVPLAVTGSDISKVNEIDKEKGIWEIELHNKVENNYSVQIRYQISGAAAGGNVKILPVRMLEVESHKGYLVVMSGGRVQVRPAGSLAGLQQENSRSIPAYFGAGDLSDAIYCFRTISGDYELDLSAVRHDAAKVLPANIEKVRMTSVVSDGGQVLTQVAMDINIGSLQFLEMKLPDKNSSLWTAFVKGKAASVSKDGDIYRIPLEESVPGELTPVEFIYAGSARRGWISSKEEFRGPKFNLPLKDIDWKFYVVPGRRYYGFGGTMEYKTAPLSVEWFDATDYSMNNLRQIESNREKAKSIMVQSEKLAQQGYQKQAKNALKSAVDYSQNDTAFNEDARIQYKNLAEQQAVVGLVQRRDEMRFNRNIQESGQLERMEEFKGGQFSADYAAKVQQSLPDQENQSLMQVAGKILEQQSAAERVSQAINITMPAHGRKLVFSRSLQIDPAADLIVSFKVNSGKMLRGVLVLVAAGVLMVAYRFGLGVWVRRFA